MKIDSEEQDDRDVVLELEEESTTVDEAQTTVVPANIDEALCDKLLNFPSPKAYLARKGINPTFMEHVLLLEKMNARRLKGKNRA